MFSMNIRDIKSIHTRLASCLVGLLLVPCQFSQADDWPRFLGPNQDGSIINDELPDDWTSEGPKRQWQLTVGSGFSGPIALEDRVILFNRQGNQEQILSLDPKTGTEQWNLSYPTSYRDNFGFDNGPRATPCADRGYLYTYGAEGHLQCTELQSGKPLWQVDVKSAFKLPSGFFGIACSPLVEGDLVIVNIGSPQDGGVVAFHRLTGKIIWKTSQDEASYSSPVAATIAGIRQAIVFDRASLKAIALKTGAIRSSYPWRPRINASVNAASPIIEGNQVLLTTSYNTGSVLLDLSDAMPKKIWSNDDALSCHYGTPVLHEGYLYGFHGRQERGAVLNCVSWKDGTLAWSETNVAIGTVTLIGGRLLILQENGELVMADATPEKYQERDRAQILPSGVRAYPAYANGILYARSPSKLVAYKVR